MQNPSSSVRALVALVAIQFGCCAALLPAKAEEHEADYVRAISARAAKVVGSLELEDSLLANRVQKLIAEQYRKLRSIHDAYDASVSRVRQESSLSEAAMMATISQGKRKAELAQFQLHRRFVSLLSAELTTQQVSQVKDGMTYGVLPATYTAYLQLLPDLSEEEKRVLKAWLIEAREYAMDAGSAEEKHGWFRKYKGKINNYLSAAGHDMKTAQQRFSKK